MKLYDFDRMFDEKLTDYISKNVGKYKEEEWEDVIPKLYTKFGDTFIKAIGDTPNGFYAKMSDEELIKALKTHLKQGVPVSEFLCNALESRDVVPLLMPLLSVEGEEQVYASNIIGSDKRAVNEYLNLIVTPSVNADFKDNLVDFVKENADEVSKRAIDYYNAGIEKEYMLEILSRTVIPSDEVFDILVKAFRSDSDAVCLHASYLASYGDERALPYLLDKIDEEGISFLEYKELLMAIECLGGSYEKQRDFSSDPYYQLLKSHDVQVNDIFNPNDKPN